MSRYEFLLFVHVAAVIVWLGTGTALAFIAIYAERSRDRALGEQLGTLAAWLGPRVFAPASLGTLVAGILLVLDGSWQGLVRHDVSEGDGLPNRLDEGRTHPGHDC